MSETGFFALAEPHCCTIESSNHEAVRQRLDRTHGGEGKRRRQSSAKKVSDMTQTETTTTDTAPNAATPNAAIKAVTIYRREAVQDGHRA